MTKEEEFAIALAKADFVQTLNAACAAAGGGSWDSIKNERFEDAVDILARNGLRMLYSDRYHMNQFMETACKAAPALQFINT